MAKSKEGQSQALSQILAKCDQDTSWDRLEKQLPQCGFGKGGICCRVCNMGPCVVNPFGGEPKVGVCGADADTIAARNFLRMVAAGTSAHSDHGRAAAHLLVEAAEGKAEGYEIKDEKKLHAVAKMFDVETDGRSREEIAKEIGELALADFGRTEGHLQLTKRAPEPRQKLWDELDIRPRAIDREVVEALHRSSEGADQDYKSLIRHACRTSLGDGWGGSMIGTEIQDILYGTPQPNVGAVNLGVLKADQVNVIVHGHEPNLSMMIALASQQDDMLEEAKSVGATGINISGICCTANELLIRQGIGIAGNMRMQEAAVATGSVEAMVVDIQCVMQSLVGFCASYHTKMITTSPKARVAGAQHINFEEATGLTTAKVILREAIQNFKNRDPEKVNIPEEKSQVVAGFSHEAINYMLGGTFRGSYRPLNDNIINGRIRGVVGVVGCTNPKTSPKEESSYHRLVKNLVANDILVVETGCAAIECGKFGMLLPEYKEAAGPGLKEVCETVGIPPVLHAGSCVDNTRILIACTAMVEEGGLGDDISQLPAAGVCIEWMHEKAVAIGHYFVSSGAFVVFGTTNPISGSPNVHKYLTEEIEQETGGKWAFETDVDKIAELVKNQIEAKRDALGINVETERKLYDMEDRRHLEV